MSKYLPEIKIKACEDYLSGKYSHKEVCEKYGIYFNDSRYSSAINDWLPIYSLYGPSAFLHSKGNQKYCINHNRNYKEAASLYGVSYSQVYSWVKKHDENGNDGLIDKRGHHKSDDELSELELLRRENIRLKKKLEEQERITLLFKKVQEFERM
jgi:transposase-like protein